MRSRVAHVVCLAACALVARPAFAGENDLVLSRLAQINTTLDDVIPNNQDFRSLSSELGVVIAPKFLSPSDTLGYSGFQFSTELSFTTINNDSNYWCATLDSDSCGAGQERGSGVMPTFGVFARKGLWFPLPSFEIGAGAVHILNSSMWAPQAYAKFALQEGFHEWPIPSLAARGTASTLVGTDQLSLSVASLDVSISKLFGVQGTVAIEPYAGWNYLWIISRSRVIDKTPQVDSETDPLDLRMNFVFPDQDAITRTRFFGGIKLRYYVFALTLEANFALPGSSVDDRGGTVLTCDDATSDLKGRCDAEDQSGSQQSYSASLSLDF